VLSTGKSESEQKVEDDIIELMDQAISSFPVEKQKKIVIACTTLHNFIRDSALSKELFQMCDEDEEYIPPIVLIR
jgi:hypothetical protein